MNKVMCILVLIALFSCKSTSVAQEKQIEKTNKPKIEKPGFGDPRDNEITSFEPYLQDQIAPGTIHFTAVIQEMNKDISVCGTQYKAAVLVNVKKVKGSGSGIVNALSSGQKTTLVYPNANVKKIDELKQKFTKNQEVKAVVKESLCPDMSKTVYEILKLSNK
ncbi:hypothetical protein [Aquimarina aggregata]|uniref:hypothetical protein n=1 Tax=Aquimarina aggregata TaxID=1642818 RepID=UPI00248F5CE4|nr:hypothetical protein [Aquimarina aggregata]